MYFEVEHSSEVGCCRVEELGRKALLLCIAASRGLLNFCCLMCDFSCVDDLCYEQKACWRPLAANLPGNFLRVDLLKLNNYVNKISSGCRHG